MTVDRFVSGVGPGPVVDGEPAAAVALCTPGPQAALLLDPALTGVTRAAEGQRGHRCSPGCCASPTGGGSTSGAPSSTAPGARPGVRRRRPAWPRRPGAGRPHHAGVRRRPPGPARCRRPGDRGGRPRPARPAGPGRNLPTCTGGRTPPRSSRLPTGGSTSTTTWWGWPGTPSANPGCRAPGAPAGTWAGNWPAGSAPPATRSPVSPGRRPGPARRSTLLRRVGGAFTGPVQQLHHRGRGHPVHHHRSPPPGRPSPRSGPPGRSPPWWWRTPGSRR